jgi:hypothetical protein
MKPERTHYLDNDTFIEALEKHFEQKKLNPEIGCPNEIAAMFLLIARKYVSKWPSTISFMYREDMVSYGVEYCLRYMYNYSRAKSENPFSYFTEIIKSAFMQLFNHEKKKRELVRMAATKMVEEELFVKIKNNTRSYRPFNNPVDSQVELDAIVHEKEKQENKTYILWEDEMVVQNLNTAFLDEIFKDDAK